MKETPSDESLKTDMGEKIENEKLAARCYYIISQCIPLVGREKELFKVAEMSQKEYVEAIDVFGESTIDLTAENMQEFFALMAESRKNQILGLIRLVDVMYKENMRVMEYAITHGIKPTVK